MDDGVCEKFVKQICFINNLCDYIFTIKFNYNKWGILNYNYLIIYTILISVDFLRVTSFKLESEMKY
ncbi:hypothetical protein BpHYR1_031841 [Brachionus plicatilis]|uniref:Uncharacterized protein n=1 Tax=Brachionus plicatilis TaxID=10195 RepID=A0A3M7QND2_BRAPC|nr:hypothetical protein BpHYR1_031841 [Brachionus plicatilis]